MSLATRPASSPDVVPAGSLAEQAYRRLRDDIVSLRLEPGAPLDDKRICAQLGMGLTPVRDALKRLTLERMVMTYPRRGTFVAEITVGDEQWLTEIRQPLESIAAALAAQRASDEQRDHLARLASGLEDDHANHTTPESRALDVQIHQAIYAATHNPYLEASLTQYLHLTLRIWHYGLRRLPSQHAAGHDQKDVVEAVVRGDAEAAAHAAAVHLGGYSGAVRSLLSG